MKPKSFETVVKPRALAVVIDNPKVDIDFNASVQEFTSLLKTIGITPEETLPVRLRQIDKAYFITQGKLDQIKTIREEKNINLIVFSDMLSPHQERNLRNYLHCDIWDRTGLILRIFEQAAVSAEGKTQVEIARLQFEKSRLAGKGILLSQQAGFTGVRGGPGETAKEKERRHIESSILKLKGQLERLQRIRDTQRKQRITKQVPNICLVGYTNAGKSTILNILTKSDVLAEDKLFATLDTTTRELYIDSQKKGIISDTVGFIQQLPPQLIAAFKSTLSELQYADLLLHVIDASNQYWQEHIEVVLHILNDLEVDKPMLYVFNKIDKVVDREKLQSAVEQYQPHVLINATSKEGIVPLVDYLRTWEKTF